jgi:hypothetical protein
MKFCLVAVAGMGLPRERIPCSTRKNSEKRCFRPFAGKIKPYK